MTTGSRLPGPGTFWYDFLTGPALGGLGALLAALVIGCATLWVSRDRRRDAAADREEDRIRTGREEWFRRLQWANTLTTSDLEDTRAGGFQVINHLSTSGLATPDDQQLLLAHTGLQLAQAIAESELAVDDGGFVVETEAQANDEEAQR